MYYKNISIRLIKLGRLIFLIPILWNRSIMKITSTVGKASVRYAKRFGKKAHSNPSLSKVVETENVMSACPNLTSFRSFLLSVVVVFLRKDLPFIPNPWEFPLDTKYMLIHLMKCNWFWIREAENILYYILYNLLPSSKYDVLKYDNMTIIGHRKNCRKYNNTIKKLNISHKNNMFLKFKTIFWSQLYSYVDSLGFS